ncbi:hypothetical protein ACB092_01G046000 [Castanea dentata]
MGPPWIGSDHICRSTRLKRRPNIRRCCVLKDRSVPVEVPLVVVPSWIHSDIFSCACAVGLGKRKRETEMMKKSSGLGGWESKGKKTHWSKSLRMHGTRHCCGTRLC